MPVIGLLGDVMLGRGVANSIARGVAPEALWSAGLRAELAACDVVVCNLECCISERGAPTERIPGKPFFFRAPPSAVRALRAAGIRAVTLANNHALDYEVEALVDTLEHLEAAGIAFAGAGPNRDAARRGLVVGAGEVRVAVLSVSDHPEEFAAGDRDWGIAYADLREGLPDWIEDELRALRDRADLVLAAPHWGPNMSVRPDDWQRRRGAELAAAGADLVAGHSAHVFHGAGRAHGRPVLYDLGDALDDYAIDRRLRNDLGLLALWRPGGDPEIELVGLRLDFAHTRIAEGSDADWIAARLAAACEELGTSVERTAEGRFELQSATVA